MLNQLFNGNPMMAFISNRRRSGIRDLGFSLLELMTSIAVMAILLTIAVPAYSKFFIMRARLSDALSILMLVQPTLEQYYLDNRSYAASSSADCGVKMPASSEYFDYQCSTGDKGESFTLTALGKSRTAFDGFKYTLTNTGLQQCWLGASWGGKGIGGSPISGWVTRYGG
jgi:type IV pilus assembly protein PilE